MTPNYTPQYDVSHGLIIGINKYAKASPLRYAVADAEAVAEVLTRRFAFDPARITVLRDDAASKTAILKAFLGLAHDGTGRDDRVVFFFAGHGHTELSRKGDVGFLVPVDGSVDDLATLIRWDELTRNADLIPAKHVLFLMDACYGGLAIKRTLKPGAMRFIKDMLVRPSRQVLTAGKGDEVVDDVGGPLPGHSPFTGHLVEALEGKATGANGILTANSVMAYVYQAVGSEDGASQTPHYGQIDGEGDLILLAPGILDKTATTSDGTKDEDMLVAVPVVQGGLAVPIRDTVTRTKEYLAEERDRLRLFELVGEEVRRVIASTGEDRFPPSAPWSEVEFQDRLEAYDQIMRDLRVMEALLGYWSTPSSGNSLTLGPKRLADQNRIASGNTGLLALRWYPALVLLYCGGIGAVAGKAHNNLRDLLLTKTSSKVGRSGETEPFVTAVIEGNRQVMDAFKSLPGHERQYVARSEYLFKLLQPQLDDALFLGSDYESSFDRFEVLMALEVVNLEHRQHGRYWGPSGRFAYKYAGRSGSNPFQEVVTEALAQGSSWPPIVAGLFEGSIDRFKEVSNNYAEHLGRLGWY